ncbi:hypothetical protein [Flavobacterium panici]|uniref:Uncharacterized protein n=1 Tax=Flavobacterium panici TaxID=2654843 RepID=A0A9N8J1A5_9FLAO|nr:hypothetical protein [Flavobacterium panici]CAC9974391.1 hypothetical protein FLAPXU55_02088 [Flavobacterium panici]
MDNYGKTKDDFMKSFLDELYSKTHFEYEHDPEVMGFFEPDDPYTDHIVAAQEHVKEFMKDSISSLPGISAAEITKQYEKMREEVFDILQPEIEKYIEEKVTVDVKWPDSIRLVDDGNGGFRYFEPANDDPKLLERLNDTIDINHQEE